MASTNLLSRRPMGKKPPPRATDSGTNSRTPAGTSNPCSLDLDAANRGRTADRCVCKIDAGRHRNLVQEAPSECPAAKQRTQRPQPFILVLREQSRSRWSRALVARIGLVHAGQTALDANEVPRGSSRSVSQSA